MPRKPAATSSRPSAGRQSTLSFNTRVTKTVPKIAKDVIVVKKEVVEPVAAKTDKEEEAAEEKGQDATVRHLRLIQKTERFREREEEKAGFLKDKLVHVKEENKEKEKGERRERHIVKELQKHQATGGYDDHRSAETRALEITEAQIRKYWAAVEKESKRVHQEGLGVGEQVLRYFDVSSQYGVCFPLFHPSLSISLLYVPVSFTSSNLSLIPPN